MRFLFPVLCRKQTDVLNRRDMGDAMYKYMNKFFCMIAAAITSYAVNMIYNITNSFAATYVCGQTTITTHTYNVCQSGNWWRPEMMGSRCGTNPSEWRSHCPSVAYDSVYNSWVSGWTCSGTIYNGTESGLCDCWYTYGAQIYASTSVGVCGTMHICSGTVRSAECNTGPYNAGYIVGGNVRTCACCPTSPVDGVPTQNSLTVLSMYNATSAAECYIVGDFSDDTGLFEYTDDNRCYYAS